MRLNKFISSTGLYSRRKADELIKDRRVSVNGETGIIGQDVNENDKVYVDGKPLEINENSVYIILNKPKGITCTTERHIEGNIIDFVNHTERIFPVGRLDKDSEGLIILTNDGDFVYKVTHPKHEITKTYTVTVKGIIKNEEVEQLRKGVKIDDYTTRPAKVKILKTDEEKDISRLEITIHEGKNRQVRRMCESVGRRVIALHRSKIGNIGVKDIELGKWRYLKDFEVKTLIGK